MYAMSYGLLLLICLFLLGGIALAAALLTNQKTRPWGIALLAAGAGVVAAGATFLLFSVGTSQPVPAEQATVLSRPPESARGVAGGTGELSALPDRTPASRDEPGEKAPGVLPAMGRSLAKAASETGVAKASRTVKDSPSVLAASLKALGKALVRERKNPGTGVADAAARPAWVDAEPGVVNGDYQMPAMVGPFATQQECDDAQPKAIGEVADDYIKRYLGPGGSRGVRLSPEFLQEHVVTDTWEEQRMTDFGAGIGSKPMIRRYVLLRFDREVNGELKRQQHRAMVQRRLRATAFGLAGILGALALTFAYLKINLTTDGRYRGGLRAGTAAAILAVVVASLLLLR